MTEPSWNQSHDRNPKTYRCQRCGMSWEEMLDFQEIECNDAQAAQMPTPDPQALMGNFSLSDLEANQRSLMLDGLWFRARRRIQQAEYLRRCEEAGMFESSPRFELVEAERPE